MKNEFKSYSAVKVGGFRLGDYSSISDAKKAIKFTNGIGFYQVINNKTGLAVWEGDKK